MLPLYLLIIIENEQQTEYSSSAHTVGGRETYSNIVEASQKILKHNQDPYFLLNK